MHVRPLTIAVTLWLLVAAPAKADQAEVLRTMTEAGLVGPTWSWDCAKPVGLSNHRLRFGVAPNGVLAAYEASDSFTAVYWIEEVHIAANGDVVVTRAMLDGLYGQPYEIVFRKFGSGLRVWSQVSLDGATVIARDGVYAPGVHVSGGDPAGGPTATWERCR